MPLAQLRVDSGTGRIDFWSNGILGEQARKGIVEGGRFEWLGQIGCKVQLLCTDLTSAQRSKQNDRQRALIAQLTDLTRQHDAVHLRHLKIKYGKFERLTVFDPCKSLLRIFGLARTHPP